MQIFEPFWNEICPICPNCPRFSELRATLKNFIKYLWAYNVPLKSFWTNLDILLKRLLVQFFLRFSIIDVWFVMFFSRVLFFSLLVLGYSSILFIILYAIISVQGLIFPFNLDLISLILNLIILSFELLAAIYGIYFVFHNAYAIKPEQKSFELKKTTESDPLFSIILPTYNPDLYALETNLLSLKKVNYPNLEVIVVDNSSEEHIIEQIYDLCSHFNVKYKHRDEIQGFKARNLNIALSVIKVSSLL